MIMRAMIRKKIAVSKNSTNSELQSIKGGKLFFKKKPSPNSTIAAAKHYIRQLRTHQ
jgi:hypothetical protein